MKGCTDSSATCVKEDCTGCEACDTSPLPTAEDEAPDLADSGCPEPCGKIDIPDGVYTSITIKSGCVVGAGTRQEPAYVPPLCCASCGDPVEGGGAFTISQDGCNLLKDSGGLIVKPIFSSSGNVTVTGCGTANSPYVLNAAASSNTCVRSTTTDVLTVASVSGCFNISHKQVATGAIDTGGLKTDKYGHVLSYAPQTENATPNVMLPLEIVNQGGIDFITLKTAQSGSYSTPYGTLTFDTYGRLTAITPATPTIAPGSFTTNEGKTVSYNQYGVITNVV